MLIPQKVRCSVVGRSGAPASGIAELRSHLAKGSSLDDGSRQRLLELAQRLARVQALGDEYAGISFSPMVTDVLDPSVAAV